jgi:hypothetical protein
MQLPFQRRSNLNAIRNYATIAAAFDAPLECIPAVPDADRGDP